MGKEQKKILILYDPIFIHSGIRKSYFFRFGAEWNQSIELIEQKKCLQFITIRLLLPKMRRAEVNKLDHKTGKVGQFWQISIFKKETLNSLSLRKTIGMS